MHLEEIGVELEPASRSLVLRWTSDSGIRVNLGAITTRGDLQSEFANWEADGLGRIDLAHNYQMELAGVFGGELRKTSNPRHWYVVTSGTTRPHVIDLLDQQGAWKEAIRRFVTALQSAIVEM